MGINNAIPASKHENDLSPLTATVIRTDHGQPAPNTKSDALKRAIDLSASLILLALLAPLMFAAWLLVRITSPGPGIYTQVRVGRWGKNFRIIKLRTMTHNCEATTGGARWSTKGDSRVTPVGRVFRKLHIDELPQLFNVIRGDMSLVGPRPERPEFVTPLAAAVPGYLERLAVKPGVTGLAQIQLPPDSDMESVRQKIVLDRAYIDNRSIWLDLRLVIGTAVYLVGFSYATVRRIFALPAGGFSSPEKTAADSPVSMNGDLIPSPAGRESHIRLDPAGLMGPRV